MTRLFIFILLGGLPSVLSLHSKETKTWPKEVQKIVYRTSIDKSEQPMLIYAPEKKEKRPLLVGLHTWSGNYSDCGSQVPFAEWCIQNEWYFIHPHFRGPNWTSDACGSEKAVQDIIDAVESMKNKYPIDNDRIYLIGASGGGHMSLLLAGKAPELWAGVSSWVPISDIYAWWKQSQNGKYSRYAKHIEKAVGGKPNENKNAKLECIKRSPITYLQNAAQLNLDINAGIYDGKSGGSVPFTHSLIAFNSVVPDSEKIDANLIEKFYRDQKIPDQFLASEKDVLYGKKSVLFRKTDSNCRVTIFEGGHEIIHCAGLNWLAQQRKKKPAVWKLDQSKIIEFSQESSQSGK